MLIHLFTTRLKTMFSYYTFSILERVIFKILIIGDFVSLAMLYLLCSVYFEFTPSQTGLVYLSFLDLIKLLYGTSILNLTLCKLASMCYVYGISTEQPALLFVTNYSMHIAFFGILFIL
jgi:hypothetical protein